MSTHSPFLTSQFGNHSSAYQPCPLCGMSGFEGNACEHCFAPADVIHSIHLRDKPPRIVGVLGPSGVGKTVYLGILLDHLARGAMNLSGFAHGAFSLSLHRNTILALERQRFPAKTPVEADRWQWVHCEIERKNTKVPPFDLVAPDVAGEAVAAELASPMSNPTIHALISRCDALIILVDILQVIADGQGQELFAMQLISYLTSLRPKRKKQKSDVPTAIVFTKSDLCEESVRDPAAFARSNAPGLWKLCEARLAQFKFFASGVAGASGWLIDSEGRESLIPLRVEPRGIIEPFAWLAGQI